MYFYTTPFWPPYTVPGKRAGVRHGGTVYIYSMFGDEVVVPMYDLHFRSLHVRGFWVSEWLAQRTRTQRQAALQVPCLLTAAELALLTCVGLPGVESLAVARHGPLQGPLCHRAVQLPAVGETMLES